ncbi:MAG TPA: trypsin-like peptidase domain-containing protein [Trueperaceae bacterium]|nr:trypsin-like peptidase domain-containing protein [Trueperaceae bacterium]
MRTIRAMTLLLLLGVTAAAFGQGLPREVRLNILEAVVQIIPYDEEAGTLVNWSGSGTIISPSGYVLTNYHVAGDLDRRIYYDWHAIFMTDPDFTDQPPEFYFWARYIAGDPTHDLAILKIEEWYDEEPIAADFLFPHVTVGDSNQLLPGDNITIVGYPGISGSTVTFTAGLMSGWLGEDFESGGKQWIKTDAKISHGNSGGGAFDENGNLIGVPTAGRTVKYDELDVEDQAYVRPISLAWALIGPNVFDVARAPSSRASTVVTPATTTPAANTPVAPVTPQQPIASSGVGPCDFCLVGPVSIGATASNAIGGVTDQINYHTYSIEVPSGTATLAIALTADADVDIAAKFGDEIQSWADEGDWEYRDISDASGATFEISLPTPGTWYVDVIYYYDTGTANYSLNVR